MAQGCQAAGEKLFLMDLKPKQAPPPLPPSELLSPGESDHMG